MLVFGSKSGLDIKKRLIKKLGGECQRCHRKYIPPVYDFHHKDPTQKEFTLNQPNLLKYSWDAIKRELKKVALLCSNCHRIVHATKDSEFVVDTYH